MGVATPRLFSCERVGELTPARSAVPDTLAGLAEPGASHRTGPGTRLQALEREWLLDLQTLGRSPRTIRWYRQKMDWYLGHSGVQTLEELTA